MKPIILLLFILSLGFGCKNEDDKVNPNDPDTKGCLTGINNDGDRVFIRCCVRAEYQAGSNIAAGGTSTWNNYTSHDWEAVKNCNECQ